MTGDIKNALFLCTGNSARSIIAEAIMSRVGVGCFRGYSAGSHPTGTVNPYAIALLKGLNYSTDDFRSKHWNEFSGPDSPQMDFVFTVCNNAASEICPIWPGQPMSAHWGPPDPAAVEGTDAQIAAAFANTYRMMNNRIEIFVNLPHASLDRLSLQRHLDKVGCTLSELA